MNNLFLIDGTSGIWKSDLIEYIKNYLVDSTYIKKYSTRELTENEDPTKLDLEFISENDFSRINPNYQYPYNGKKYGFKKSDLLEALKKCKNVFLIIRNYDTINLIRNEFKDFNVVTVFIYTDVSEVTKRLPLTSRKGLKESVKQAFKDYLRNPELYDKIIINGSSANDFYRLINTLISCCSKIPEKSSKIFEHNKFYAFIPRRLKFALGIILGIILPFLVGLIVNMVTESEWNYWKYLSFIITSLFLLIIALLEYIILFESDKSD